MKLSDISIIAWLTENQAKTETGVPLDFREHLFMYDIYRDWNPVIVCKKAAQIGFTTAAFFKLAYVLDKKRLDSIYTLPTDDEVRTLVSGKFNRIIAQNPFLKELTKDKDSVEQKQVGSNIVYFRGTWGERAAISHTSDLNVHDEASRSKQDIVELYETRQQHSKHKWRWIFSNPSVSGDIVDRYWHKSDKKEWFVTCPHCGETDKLSMDHIDRARKIFLCLGCGEEMSDNTRRTGKWVKTAEGEYSGYHISLLFAPWVSAAQILDYEATQSREQFTNFVLGEPYVGEGNTVLEENFWKNLTTNPNVQDKVVIGCDSGIKKHFVCGNSKGLFYYGVTESWDEVAKMLDRWKDSVLVVDAMPDITGPRALREKYKGRVFLNHYSRDRKTMRLIKWGEGNEHGNVVSDRNRLLQLVLDEFADQRIPLQGMRQDWIDYVSHWRTLYRVTDVDNSGNQTFKWESSNGMDHWAHATSYWRIGMDRFGASGGRVQQAVDPMRAISAQKPFSTGAFVKQVTKPVWWDRETS